MHKEADMYYSKVLHVPCQN